MYSFKVLLLALLLLASVIVPVHVSQAQENPLAGTNWVLATLNGEALPGTVQIVLAFDADGQAGGVACNHYGSAYAVDGEKLTFEGIVSTLMACEEPLMSLESAYFGVLQAAATYQLSEGVLEIFGADDTALLFVAGPTLPGTSAWTLVAINGESPLEGTEATLEFNADGTLGGQVCNTYGASYTVEGDALTVTAIRSTKMACDEALNRLESSFFGALQGVSGFTMQANSLQLVGAEGVMLQFVPVNPLAETEWVLESMVGFETLTGELPTLNFGADGRVTGSGGCNTYTGVYLARMGSLAFGMLAMTERACVDSAVMAQEAAYLMMLSQAITAEIGEDGKLTIMTAADAVLVFAPAE